MIETVNGTVAQYDYFTLRILHEGEFIHEQFFRSSQ